MKIMTDPRVEQIALDKLRPYPGNPRTHSKKQVKQIAASIARFGFTSPLLVSDDLEIIAGAGRLLAARELGMERVPVIRLAHLDAAERRAYVLADNQLALKAGWDRELLAIELGGLADLEFDLSVIGFEPSELEIILGDAQLADPAAGDDEDTVPALEEAAVTRLGDVWQLGAHRLVCGDARDAEAYPGEICPALAKLVSRAGPPLRSMTTTSWPLWARYQAEVIPTTPLPTITTRMRRSLVPCSNQLECLKTCIMRGGPENRGCASCVSTS